MLRKFSCISLAFTIIVILFLAGCGGGGGVAGDKTGLTAPTDMHNAWTWMSGSNTFNQKSIYGTQGIAAAGNIPGGRVGGVSWLDGKGNHWLFGGPGYDSTATVGDLNDLWKFDGSNWTWVSGSNVVNQKGIYGTKYNSAVGNAPGGRYGAVGWIDSSGKLWLFGGQGEDSAGSSGQLNDLWKFDGSTWTWVSGSDIVYQKGIYGTQGAAFAGNTPGARGFGISWFDSSGNLWLFGGLGYDSTATVGDLNDLWKFDGSNWTWVGGSNIVNQKGIYGTQGVVAAGNIPGARGAAVSWIDSSGNHWIFGGAGYDSAGTTGLLNDLWKFDGSNWIWVGGSNIVNQSGVYGTQGTAAAGNIPGGRYLGVSWSDGFLFGGTTGTTYFNDLWRYQP